MDPTTGKSAFSVPGTGTTPTARRMVLLHAIDNGNPVLSEKTAQTSQENHATSIALWYHCT
jgi:hypothetical protein